MIGLCIFLFAVGVAIGWMWGTTAEQKLWLDAICGREKIFRGATKEKAE